MSNFGLADMEELIKVPNGNRCATNQVYYNLSARGIENDLLPWCEQHGMPVMAYSPLGGAGASSTAVVVLAWTICSGHVITIPESGSAEHVRENAVALSLVLTQQELQTLDAKYLLPKR